MVDARLALLEQLGLPLADGAKVLDFGCGEGVGVEAFARRGFDTWGADLPVELGDGPRLMAIEDPYRLPFPDATFDFVNSYYVLEHVQDYDSAFREIRRVLRPGAVSIHVYPPKWMPIEPHSFIPFATILQSRAWVAIWARLGIRNQFQRGLPAAETASLNHRYLIDRTNYPSRGRMLAAARRHFADVRYVEREHLTVRKGSVPPALARPYGSFRARVLLAA